MYYYNGAQRYKQFLKVGRPVSGFDLAWFSSLILQAPMCLRSSLCYVYIKYEFLLTSSLPFSELSLVGLAVDLVG